MTSLVSTTRIESKPTSGSSRENAPARRGNSVCRSPRRVPRRCDGCWCKPPGLCAAVRRRRRGRCSSGPWRSKSAGASRLPRSPWRGSSRASSTQSGGTGPATTPPDHADALANKGTDDSCPEAVTAIDLVSPPARSADCGPANGSAYAPPEREYSNETARRLSPAAPHRATTEGVVCPCGAGHFILKSMGVLTACSWCGPLVGGAKALGFTPSLRRWLCFETRSGSIFEQRVHVPIDPLAESVAPVHELHARSRDLSAHRKLAVHDDSVRGHGGRLVRELDLHLHRGVHRRRIVGLDEDAAAADVAGVLEHEIARGPEAHLERDLVAGEAAVVGALALI